MLLLDSVEFSYSDAKVIDNISLSVPKGSNVAIIGESGCGKSTLLKLIYGIYDLHNGSISYDKKPILGPKHKLIPGEDYMKYLAQDFGLMPYVTARENVGKFLSNIDKDKKRSRTNELLEMVDMLAFSDVKTHELSGGQQQRIAIAKALALEPEVLLLDEPFSQIDAFRTNNLRRNLFSYLKEKQITCLVATHDSNDVLPFADQVAVLRNGKCMQNGTPLEVYSNPNSFYTASLFGDVNEIRRSLFEQPQVADNIDLVYPHQLCLSENGFPVSVLQNYYRGSHFLIKAQYADGTVLFQNPKAIEIGTKILLSVNKKAP